MTATFEERAIKALTAIYDLCKKQSDEAGGHVPADCIEARGRVKSFYAKGTVNPKSGKETFANKICLDTSDGEIWIESASDRLGADMESCRGHEVVVFYTRIEVSERYTGNILKAIVPVAGWRKLPKPKETEQGVDRIQPMPKEHRSNRPAATAKGSDEDYGHGATNDDLPF